MHTKPHTRARTHAYARVCVVWYAFVCIQVLLILHVKCRYFFEERLF